ncbi:unnamed protein product, partial [Leptidea sinapis]
KGLVMCGDFNIDMLKIDKTSLDLENFLAQYNLKLQIKECKRPKSGSCIDNIAHGKSKSGKSEVIDWDLSDHTAQLVKYPVRRTCSLKYWRTTIPDYHKENLNKFISCLNNITFDVYETNDPNTAYDSFYETFKLYYDLCFLTKTITIKTRNKPKWITTGIKACSKLTVNLIVYEAPMPHTLCENNIKS